ncbi:MAG: hypothetical protein MI919_24360 [Holophagales bacterium]|nr:hypothetical protein [Holophagales bacterium]
MPGSAERARLEDCTPPGRNIRHRVELEFLVSVTEEPNLDSTNVAVKSNLAVVS